ncbi:MAG: SUF system NifU family Fe-S cluster assembly protein [Candidatus Woesearchaeota archaeon]
MSLNIYQENILDHYQNPRNFGKLKNPDLKAHDSNPLCGDTFDFEIKTSKDKQGNIIIKDVRFNGHGCAISTASASMLTEKIIGKKIDDVLQIDKKDILEMLNVELSHVRIKCAMLPLKVLKLALYKNKEIKNK